MLRNKIFKKWFLRLFAAGIMVLIASIILQQYISISAEDDIWKNTAEVPVKQAALVLGAKVFKDGRLSGMVQDRADAGIDLYRVGKVQKILVSGDHGKSKYDEVNTIRNYILAQGIPAEDVFMDHAGFDTYSSLYRARDVFKAQSLVLVSQEFHLPRALFLARQLKIDAVGFVADKQLYTKRSKLISGIREVPASVKAFFEGVFKPEPHFLGEAIPLSGDGRLTEDKNP